MTKASIDYIQLSNATSFFGYLGDPLTPESGVKYSMRPPLSSCPAFCVLLRQSIYSGNSPQLSTLYRQIDTVGWKTRRLRKMKSLTLHTHYPFIFQKFI